jgi:hypothetical protein
MEISKVVPELIRRFSFTLVDPNAELRMENVWFVKQKNINCYITAREKVGEPSVALSWGT